MRYRKQLALLLCAALLSAALCGCARPAAPKAEGMTLTDMCGRSVTLPGPAERIVVLTAADCEILYALGAGERVVGRGEYCNYPADVLEVPSVQSGTETNYEQVIALEPDVVVMSTMDQTEEQMAAFENAGVRVVATEAPRIEDVYAAIRLLGALVERTDEAETLVTGMQKTFASIRERAENTGKTVYFEVSPLAYGLWAAGKNTFMDELAGILGLENAFFDVDGWAEISAEQVIDRDPDYIVSIAMYFGEGAPPVDEIKSRTGWETLQAIQNDHVCNVDSDMVARPGPRLADAAQSLYDFVYGG